MLAKRKNRRRINAEERRAKRRQAIARVGRIAIRTLLGAACAVATVVGSLSLYRWTRVSPIFALKRISFQGLRRASDAELISLSGLSLGQNVFQVDKDSAERAMAAHPWVKSSRVERHLPDALEVFVTEQIPAAIAALGTVYLLNADGEPFKRAQPDDEADLPKITGINRDEYVQSPEQTVARFRQALQVMKSYDDSGTGKPKAKLSEVRVSALGISLVTDTGEEIRVGEGEIEEKLRRLAKVRAELQRRGLVAQVIRLDNRARPNWVTVKTAPNSSIDSNRF